MSHNYAIIRPILPIVLKKRIIQFRDRVTIGILPGEERKMTTISMILKDKGNNVETADCGASLNDVLLTLAQKKIGAIVIADGQGGVAGILSERDIVRAIAETTETALRNPVDTVMTKNVVTCDPSMTVDQVLELMTSGRFRHMPVVENSKLCGIVSIGDIVKLKIAEATAEAEALKSYIGAG